MGKGKKLFSFRLDENLIDQMEKLDPDLNKTERVEKNLGIGVKVRKRTHPLFP